MFRRLGSFFLDVSEVIVFAIGIFFFVYLLIMRPHKIEGESMMPNYQDAEYLLTEKVSYYFHKPKRGDVVVLKPPKVVSSGDEFIKRVVGLPGESIKISGGRVFINGQLLGEDYIPTTTITHGGSFLVENTEYAIPNNLYFVMGDNREHSSDSRFWGPVSLNISPNGDREGINGRAWLIYWPINKAGPTQIPTYAYGL